MIALGLFSCDRDLGGGEGPVNVPATTNTYRKYKHDNNFDI
jgi:hypothetical protein